MSAPNFPPLFDDVARDGNQRELASLIRRAAPIAPFGPNSIAAHARGETVMLTGHESELAARAVLESDWLARHITAAVNQALSDAADEIDGSPDCTCADCAATNYAARIIRARLT